MIARVKAEFTAPMHGADAWRTTEYPLAWKRTLGTVLQFG
jgi:hypothetical protein